MLQRVGTHLWQLHCLNNSIVPQLRNRGLLRCSLSKCSLTWACVLMPTLDRGIMCHPNITLFSNMNDENVNVEASAYFVGNVKIWSVALPTFGLMQDFEKDNIVVHTISAMTSPSHTTCQAGELGSSGHLFCRNRVQF